VLACASAEPGATLQSVMQLWRTGQLGEFAHVAAASLETAGEQGVSLLTVHGAKGLEFPVVVLCDLACPEVAELPTSLAIVERNVWLTPLAFAVPHELRENAEVARELEREEAARIAYVAATRAKSLLVVAVLGEGYAEGWLRVLGAGIYPDIRNYRMSARATNVPAFGSESVGPLPAKTRAPRTVAPGLVTPKVGTHPVVFWDPNVLPVAPESVVGFRGQALLGMDPAALGHARATRDYADYLSAAKRVAVAIAAAPRIVGASAYLAKLSAAPASPGSSEEAPPAVTLIRIGTAPARGKAARPLSASAAPLGAEQARLLGTLVHALIAEVVEVESIRRGAAVDIAASAALRALHLGCSAELGTQAAVRVAAFFASALGAELRAADAWYPEYPVYTASINGNRIRGVVDLVVRIQSQYRVFDFKTDYATDSEILERHAPQVRLYAAAVANATCAPCSAVLVVV
jgi:ATP-dependent exoDNAse (exonuclease V) beta subunit